MEIKKKKKKKKEKEKKIRKQRNRTQPVQESSNINLSTCLVIAIHTFIRISLLTVLLSYIWGERVKITKRIFEEGMFS